MALSDRVMPLSVSAITLLSHLSSDHALHNRYMVYVNKTYSNLYEKIFPLILYHRGICAIKIIASYLEREMDVCCSKFLQKSFLVTLHVTRQQPFAHSVLLRVFDRYKHKLGTSRSSSSAHKAVSAISRWAP
jgi:hypothetical protein